MAVRTLQDTHQRLIDTAFELFNQHGFNAVGLDNILTAVGVTKTTFYNHFPSKDDLIVAVLDDYCEREEIELMTHLQEVAGDDACCQLKAMFHLLDEWMRQPDFRGCIFVTAAAEFPCQHHPVHEAAARQKKRWRAIYTRLACEAGAQDPALLADQFSLLAEGAVVLRHVSGDMAAAHKASIVADMLLAAYLPNHTTNGATTFITAHPDGNSTMPPASHPPAPMPN